MESKKNLGFSTRAIHVGQQPDPQTGSIVPPVYKASTYAQDEPGKYKNPDWDYARAGNPNFTNLEQTVAALEGGKFARVFATGMSCMMAILFTLEKGDHIIGIENLYSGTRRILGRFAKKYGIEFHEVPATLEALSKAIEEFNPKAFFIESPTNPHLEVHDLEAIIGLMRGKAVMTVVDNTLATPVSQNPLEMGADVVMHSATKYLNGHSDALLGAIITNNQEIDKSMYDARTWLGLTPAPDSAWLVSRGVKTLKLRMQQHEANALELAKWLEQHPKVLKVYYPGLESHPTHELAKKQMKGFGGVLSVDLDLNTEQTRQFLSNCQLFHIAESLGGVESTSAHLASTCYVGASAEEKAKRCIGEGFVRLSVGIEDIEDLIADIEQALASVV